MNTEPRTVCVADFKTTVQKPTEFMNGSSVRSAVAAVLNSFHRRKVTRGNLNNYLSTFMHDRTGSLVIKLMPVSNSKNSLSCKNLFSMRHKWSFRH